MSGKFALLAVGLVLAGSVGMARADAAFSFCYNWSCKDEVAVLLPEPLLIGVKRQLALSRDAADERARLADALGRLYAEAARQSPLANDRAGNIRDAEENGRMDCIDHASNSTGLLRLLEARGWLRWHRVLEPARRSRFVLVQHFAAQLLELAELPAVVPAMPAEVADVVAEDLPAGPRFVVDSWFVDPGQPAVVMPLENWMRGDGPDVD